MDIYTRYEITKNTDPKTMQFIVYYLTGKKGAKYILRRTRPGSNLLATYKAEGCLNDNHNLPRYFKEVDGKIIETKVIRIRR